MNVASLAFDIKHLRRERSRYTLSKYFPRGTNYFYGYPSGEESGFLNNVPPSIEELVSARPLVCAGENVTVITFANTVRSDVHNVVERHLGTKRINQRQTRIFPAHIDENVTGKKRNTHVKESLKDLVRPGSLVMAQPFLDKDMRHLFQISPRLTNWLNDKKNMTSFIPEKLLPQRYMSFKDGQALFNTRRSIPLPSVVKVSSSSAGDGVYICHDEQTLNSTKQHLKNTTGTIVIEQYIEAVANFGIQFGIPHDHALPIDIIGVNQQLTTPGGEFVGGIVDAKQQHEELKSLKNILLNEVLPHVRELGWYGVGCFDVLPDRYGNFYIIDSNFRMTGMTAYLMLAANKQINTSLLSFGGEFKGTLNDFERIITGISPPKDRKKIHILALTEVNGVCRCNGAILFEDQSTLINLAKQLTNAGLKSKALDFIVQ
jgi:hypothetical protein